MNDSPRYAFVQKDETDGKDYLIELDGHPLAGDQVKPTGTRYPVDGDGIRLLSPVIPSKVYGLAKNYEAHAQFMHEAGHSEIAHAPEDMVIFSKPSTSVIGPDDPIVIPSYSNDMNFEPEVAVIMGRIAKNVPVEKAMDYVLGFTCVNDVTLRDLQGADVILVGVSRSGKTPTSLYLAMQHGLKVANYPLIPEDFERRQLPPALVPHRKKIFGLTIDPQRLSQIRNERRPGSKYADLANCRYEVSEAEAMMRRSGIRWLSSITKSIEEIATTILQEVRPERLAY